MFPKFHVRDLFVIAFSVSTVLLWLFWRELPRWFPIIPAAWVLSLFVLLLVDWQTGPPSIWKTQLAMMQASGQQTPKLPTLTRDSLLYISLIAEELAELCGTTKNILATTMGQRTGHSYAQATTHLILGTMATEIHVLSRQLRLKSATLPASFYLALDKTLACAVLDDAADITVVSAGFALSTGLPIAEGYAEVQRSNLSKRNPDTGIIEKDTSGKWIKGAQFSPPALMPLMEELWQLED
jgi:hypothetical protein